MRVLRMMCCAAAALMIAGAGIARADEFNKLTVVTFSGPVEIPGKTLPAGTYRFQLADPESGRRVIQISDKDGKKTYGMFLTMANQRLRPSDKPIVMFREAPAGSPLAVRAWFYPGETYGYEFVYPRSQAMKIAKASHSPVLSTAADRSSAADETVASVKATPVTRIDETGNASSDEALKDSASAPVATSGASSATPAAAADPMPQAARAPRQHLPQTASELPLLMLFSVVMLAAGFAVRILRQHTA